MKRLFIILSIFVALSIVGLALASPARQGAFPQTGILDDFNRTDGPIGANWTTVFGNGFVVDTLQAAQDTNDLSLTFWITPTSADSEAYAIIPTRQSQSSSFSVFARIDSEGNVGYGVEIQRDDVNGDNLIIDSYVSGLQLLIIPISYEDGDGIGIRCVGDTIYAWYYKLADGWILKGSIINTDTITGGFIGFYTNDLSAAVVRVDDFGGGEIIVAEPTPTPTPTITPTGGITSTIPCVVVPIPGGQAQPNICIVYSVTVGEIMIGSILLLLVLIISGRWLYDVAMDVFQVRNAAIGSWVSRKLYKRWINRMVE